MDTYSLRRVPHRATFEGAGLPLTLRRWGDADKPLVVMLHGWMDAAATFQFLVDALPDDLFQRYSWLALDWRGFGRSGRSPRSYFFPDYLADLDALLAAYSPSQPVVLLGHSMGGMVAGLYAGVRPERVSQLISLEGFGLPDSDPTQAPKRLQQWLDGLRAPPVHHPMVDLEALVKKLQKQHPRLTEAQAAYLASELGEPFVDGAYALLADPAHRLVNPVLYRLAEAEACWRNTQAPVLWLYGSDRWVFDFLKEDDAAFARRCRHVPQLQCVEILHAGHMLHWEQPQQVAMALQHFLGSSRGG